MTLKTVTGQPDVQSINPSNDTTVYKIAVFGGGGRVGTSSLISHYISNMWVEGDHSAIKDPFRKEIRVVVDRNHYIFEILDSSGLEQFKACSDQEIQDHQGFILVYDITNFSSLCDLARVCYRILRVKRATMLNSQPGDNLVVPLILVGNKLDLEVEREVSCQQGECIAGQLKCPHYETSAKLGTNVNEIFYHLAQIIVNREEMVRLRKASGSGTSSSSGVAGKNVDGDNSAEARCCIIL